MAKMITKKCKCCKKEIQVREADHNRGWGDYCNKSCKAKHQTSLTGISGPDYKADGMRVNQMRNGKYAKSKFNGKKGRRGIVTNVHYEEWDDEVIDGDVVWSRKYGCWIELADENGFIDDTHPFSSEAFEH